MCIRTLTSLENSNARETNLSHKGYLLSKNTKVVDECNILDVNTTESFKRMLGKFMGGE